MNTKKQRKFRSKSVRARFNFTSMARCRNRGKASLATWWYPTTLSATRRHVGYSQRSGKSRYSKRRPCCVSCSVQRLRTRSVSPTTFFGRSPKVSGSMFNSTTKCPSLRFMITHSIGGVSLRQSNFRMFSICNCEAPKRLLSVKPRAKYRL